MGQWGTFSCDGDGALDLLIHVTRYRRGFEHFRRQLRTRQVASLDFVGAVVAHLQEKPDRPVGEKTLVTAIRLLRSERRRILIGRHDWVRPAERQASIAKEISYLQAILRNGGKVPAGLSLA